MTTGIIGHQLKASIQKSDRFFANDFQLENNEFRDLSLTDFKGVALILIICLALNLTLFVCEVIVKDYMGNC